VVEVHTKAPFEADGLTAAGHEGARVAVEEAGAAHDLGVVAGEDRISDATSGQRQQRGTGRSRAVEDAGKEDGGWGSFFTLALAFTLTFTLAFAFTFTFTLSFTFPARVGADEVDVDGRDRHDGG
jgi:hypothetical protein